MNQFIMASDLVKSLNERISEYGDIPIMMSSFNNLDTRDMIKPLRHIVLGILRPTNGEATEHFILLADYDITMDGDDDVEEGDEEIQ